MAKIVRIINSSTYRNSEDLDPIKKRYKERLKGITICLKDADDRVVSCVDYSVYYTDIYWDGNLPAGGIKLIDEQQNGSGMANQGGTDWKESADPAEALRKLSRILDAIATAEKIEVMQKHP